MRLLKREFKEWLEAQPSNRVAGYPEDEKKCVIVNFLKSRGKENVTVYLEDFNIGNNNYDMPKWGNTFQDLAYDHAEKLAGTRKVEKVRITFGTALKILNEV